MFLHVSWETWQTQTCVCAIQMVKYCFAASDDGKETPVYSRVPNKHVDVYSFSAKVSRPTAKSDELRNEFFRLMRYLWSDKEFLNTKEAVIFQWFSELFLKGCIHVFWSGSGKADLRSVGFGCVSARFHLLLRAFTRLKEKRCRAETIPELFCGWGVEWAGGNRLWSFFGKALFTCSVWERLRFRQCAIVQIQPLHMHGVWLIHVA